MTKKYKAPNAGPYFTAWDKAEQGLRTEWEDYYPKLEEFTNALNSFFNVDLNRSNMDRPDIFQIGFIETYFDHITDNKYDKNKKMTIPCIVHFSTRSGARGDMAIVPPLGYAHQGQYRLGNREIWGRVILGHNSDFIGVPKITHYDYLI